MPPSSEKPNPNRIVLLSFLIPPALTFLMMSMRTGDLAAPVAFIGSAIGGITCGVAVARHGPSDIAMRILRGVVLSVVCTAAIFVMSFLGCVAGASVASSH
jgi:hypothetical protein